MPEDGFFYGRTFNYMTFVEQRHASGSGSGATIMFVSVGMMSNTWVLIIAGRQAKRPDIRYRINTKYVELPTPKIRTLHTKETDELELDYYLEEYPLCSSYSIIL